MNECCESESMKDLLSLEDICEDCERLIEDWCSDRQLDADEEAYREGR